MIFIANAAAKDNRSDYEFKFNRPLRINSINYFTITSTKGPLDNGALFIAISNPIFKTAAFSFKLNANSTLFTKDGKKWQAEGYFFLPNIIPVGNVTVAIRKEKNVLFQMKTTLQQEVVFHNPIFQKGFPALCSESEMGMKYIKADAFPVSRICFANPKKKAFFFFSVRLKDQSKAVKNEKLLLRIFIKQWMLDEIRVDEQERFYVYCLSKPLLGAIDWLKIRFETYTYDGKPVVLKEVIYEFGYFHLVPFNGIPKWINHFLMKIDYPNQEFSCCQD